MVARSPVCHDLVMLIARVFALATLHYSSPNPIVYVLDAPVSDQMSDTIRVFINATPVDVPAGCDVAQAVRAFDPELERQVASGSAFVTDGRGLELDWGAPLAWGAILRVIVRARRSPDADT
jgi:hypothetical protein